jgi:flavin-dependent dehydrogenase
MVTAYSYDAIVVGARCAGSPTAMLLARQGLKVLLLDRDHFPSDTISTHLIHPPGVESLRRWGLLNRLAATGCPPIGRYSFDFGAFTIAGRPRAGGSADVAYGPRRTVLDKLLVDAAAEAGVEVREGCIVDELLFTADGGVDGVRYHNAAGATTTEHARVVVGADGRHSSVARAIAPEHYHDTAPIQVSYYTYWSNLPTTGFEVYVRPSRAWAAFPTHDGLTLVVAGWPHAEFDTNKKDVEGAYMRALEIVPAFADRVRAATREAPFRGTTVPSYFRKPFGAGWALVGDAGYNKDPVTAFGITDAFRDAELCAVALGAWLAGEQPFEPAMTGYQQTRDEHSLPMFELTCDLARFAPPSADMQMLLGATAASAGAQEQFVSMMAGTLPVPAFFAPDNVARIMAAAGRA